MKETTMKNKVYVESSVISFLTARPSRDLIVAAYQQITSDWWNNERNKYQCYISQVVIDEVSQGDQQAAAERLKTITDFIKIGFNDTVFKLIEEYNQVLEIPERAKLDVYHLALAVGNGMDFILTWNFKHMANAFVRDKLYRINGILGLQTPAICTPEELIGGIYD